MTRNAHIVTIYNDRSGCQIRYFFKTDTGKSTDWVVTSMRDDTKMTTYLDQEPYAGTFVDGDSIYPQVEVLDGGNNPFVPNSDGHVIYDSTVDDAAQYNCWGGAMTLHVDLQ